MISHPAVGSRCAYTHMKRHMVLPTMLETCLRIWHGADPLERGSDRHGRWADIGFLTKDARQVDTWWKDQHGFKLFEVSGEPEDDGSIIARYTGSAWGESTERLLLCDFWIMTGRSVRI